MSPCLVVEREDCVLVDVVGGDDGERLEPRHLELLSDGHEGLARHLQEDASIACTYQHNIYDIKVNKTKFQKNIVTLCVYVYL